MTRPIEKMVDDLLLKFTEREIRYLLKHLDDSWLNLAAPGILAELDRRRKKLPWWRRIFT